jgi:flagellar hook protein FlgE
MLRALYSGVSGLTQQTMRLDVIGNNIANVNTVGFKSARVTLGDEFSQTLRGASLARRNRGGINPIQIGNGVKTHSITNSFAQGAIQVTGGQSDLALQGDGFFIINNGELDSYTRAGSFGVDSLGRIVQSGTGFFVQGYAYDRQSERVSPALGALTLPFGETMPAEATESITLSGNFPLDSEAHASIFESATFEDPTGTAATAATLLTDLRQNEGDALLSVGDQLRFTATVGGSEVDGTFDVTAGSTFGDFAAFVETTLGAPAGNVSVEYDGSLRMEGDVERGLEGAIGSVRLQATDTLGAPRSEFNVAAAIGEIQSARSATEIVQDTVVYDGLGAAHTVRLTFTRENESLAWGWSAEMLGEEATALTGTSGRLTFFDDGTLAAFSYDDDSTALAFDPGSGAHGPQSVRLDSAGLGEASGITLLSSGAALITEQDGFPPGEFVNFAIDGSGRVFSVFSNGVTDIVGDLAVARFRDPTSLVKDGDNLFIASSNSGEPIVQRAAEVSGTSIIAGALEQSNVDLAHEFSEMIVTQRAFQASARVIQTSSEILSELIQISR